MSPDDGRYAVGTTVTYSCRQGYTLQGNGVLRCEDNGEYSSPAPTCAGELGVYFCISRTCTLSAYCSLNIQYFGTEAIPYNSVLLIFAHEILLRWQQRVALDTGIEERAMLAGALES